MKNAIKFYVYKVSENSKSSLRNTRWDYFGFSINKLTWVKIWIYWKVYCCCLTYQKIILIAIEVLLQIYQNTDLISEIELLFSTNYAIYIKFFIYTNVPKLTL